MSILFYEYFVITLSYVESFWLPFWVGESQTPFDMYFMTFKLKCPTIGVHLKLYIYPQTPLFGGAGETLNHV